MHPMDRYFDATADFLLTKTWRDARLLISKRPELLDDFSEDVLEMVAKAQPDAAAVRLVHMHRSLLIRCKQVGIDVAFAEIPAADPEFFATKMH